MLKFDQQRGSRLFFIIAIPVLLISQYLSLRFNSKVHDDFAWVTHTFQVSNELQSTKTTVLDIQNGLRGYIITTTPNQITLMNRGFVESNAHVDKIRRLTADNPAQQKNVDQLIPLLRARISHANLVLQTFKAKGFKAAQTLITAGEGTRLTIALLLKLDQMQDIESDLLEKREAAAHHSASASSLTVIFGGLFSTFLLAFAAFFIRRDFKERAKANAAIQISEQKFKATFSYSPMGIGMATLDGRWLDVNRAMCKIVGYSMDELIGHHFNEIAHPDDFGIGPNQVKRVLDNELDVVAYEKRVIAKSGAVVHLLIHVTALKDVAGKTEKLLGEFLDITERKKTEAALLQEKEFTEKVTSLVPNSIYVFDMSTQTYVYSNYEFGAFLGYSRAEIEAYGSSFMQKILHPADVAVLSSTFSDSGIKHVDGTLLENVMQLKNSKGEWKWVLSRLAVFKKDASGMPLQLIGVLQDISELKQKEAELAKAVKTKAEFLANMSHEIRTPLNGIIAAADILLETSLDQEQIRFARIVQSAGTALLTIINHILDFSKIEADKFEMEEVEFPFANTVEDQLELLVGKAREKKLVLASFIDPGLPLNFIGDPGRFSQILLNLIGNAIKFTSTGGVVVRVTEEALLLPQPHRVRIRVEVEDTGIGVSEAVAAKLFQPFTQADGSTSRKYGGTGLGLSISKKLVEYMGGEIGVKLLNFEARENSEINKAKTGSTFWFTAEFALPEPVAFLPNPDFLRDLRVLICDSDLLSVHAIAEYLDAWKMRNTIEASLDLAIVQIESARTEKDPYQIFVVGRELLRDRELEIQKISEALKPVLKIIVLDSISSRSTDSFQDLLKGVVDWVGKPVKQSTLLDTMMTALGQAAVLYSLEAQPPRQTQKVELSAAQKQANRRYRILVAEDNSVNQIIALKILGTLGYTAQAVANGQEAIDALHQNHYDLVLMDCQMPEMDGFEAAAQVRLSADLKVRGVPIIALTANAMKGDEERCLGAGMNDYLSKPIRKETLASKVALWLG